VLAWAAAFVLLATRRHWRHMLSRRGVPWLALPVVGALFDVVWTVTSGVTDYQAQPKFTNTFWENVALSRSQIDRITMR
jgi:hypothetical protein